MDNIKAFKLVSGEDIVSQFVKTDDGYTLIEPRRILLMPAPEGFGFIYVSLSLCDPTMTEISIKNEHIIFESEVEDGMKDKYVKEVSGSVEEDTNIIVPNNEIVF